MNWTAVYFDQGEEGYDDSDEGLPLPKLNDDSNDLAPFIPADKAAVLCALRLTGTHILTMLQICDCSVVFYT